MPKFYSSSWDPLMICLQIIVMQCVFYTTAGFFMYSLGQLVEEGPIYLDHFFSPKEITLTTRMGRVASAAFLFASVASAVSLVFVVERAKKCLDFAATMHIFHAFGCLIYSGLPTVWLWWVLQALSMILMTVVGEYLCWKQEMKEIPLRNLNIIDL